jgi:hypothetical protein
VGRTAASGVGLGRNVVVDTGRYNEVMLGTFVLGKLFRMEDVYDWKFGMERREDFPKFDDIVVGIQPREEDEMGYYAFQLKGCDGKQKTFGPHSLFHELAPPNGKCNYGKYGNYNYGKYGNYNYGKYGNYNYGKYGNYNYGKESKSSYSKLQ